MEQRKLEHLKKVAKGEILTALGGAERSYLWDLIEAYESLLIAEARIEVMKAGQGKVDPSKVTLPEPLLRLIHEAERVYTETGYCHPQFVRALNQVRSAKCS